MTDCDSVHCSDRIQIEDATQLHQGRPNLETDAASTSLSPTTKGRTDAFFFGQRLVTVAASYFTLIHARVPASSKETHQEVGKRVVDINRKIFDYGHLCRLGPTNVRLGVQNDTLTKWDFQ